MILPTEISSVSTFVLDLCYGRQYWYKYKVVMVHDLVLRLYCTTLINRIGILPLKFYERPSMYNAWFIENK